MIYKKFDDKLRELPDPYAQKTKKLRAEQQKLNYFAEEEITLTFKDALKAEYGLNLTDKAHEILFELAWSDGHHAGYADVESQYDDQLRLFLELEEANQKQEN